MSDGKPVSTFPDIASVRGDDPFNRAGRHAPALIPEIYCIAAILFRACEKRRAVMPLHVFLKGGRELISKREEEQ
jgi:hypothetical protein